jgi:poly(3-hydroxybutyrate) depolymerase
MSLRASLLLAGAWLLIGCADDDPDRDATKPPTTQADSNEAHAQASKPDAGSGDTAPRDAGGPIRNGESMRDASSSKPDEPPHEQPNEPTQKPPTDWHDNPGMPPKDDGLDAGSGDDDAGPARPPRPEVCKGKRGAPGNTTRMYMGRSYIVHIPPDISPNAALPVMLVFHGAGSKGADMQVGTGFDVLADQVGIVTVYPDGQAGNAPWNVGRNVCPPGNFVSTNADDVAYVEHMLDDIAKDQCIDEEHIFATGFSMGGFFTNELGCRVGHSRLKGIAPASGGTHTGDCPGAPIPVLILHGDSDQLINYSCGTRAHDLWVERNGCSTEVDRVEILNGHCDFNKNCPKGGQVAMCTFDGLQHSWAYPPMYDNEGLLIWYFFGLL